MQVYCIKCKSKIEVSDTDLALIKTKNNRSAATGKCPKCGTKIYKFLNKEDAERLEK